MVALHVWAKIKWSDDNGTSAKHVAVLIAGVSRFRCISTGGNVHAWDDTLSASLASDARVVKGDTHMLVDSRRKST